MKIGLVCSHGGHLTEMDYLANAFCKYDTFYITYESKRTNISKYKYKIKNIGYNPFRMAVGFINMFIILIKEKPDVLVSTGSEIAIPAFYLSKLLFKTKNVYIESFACIKKPSLTGKIVYPVTDVLFVQSISLLSFYGKKAQFGGALF